jgi:hypothetical protein
MAFTAEQIAAAQRRLAEGERKRRERLERARAELAADDPSEVRMRQQFERTETNARLSAGHRQADEGRKGGRR